MLDTTALLARADAWDKAHPPAGIGPVIRRVLAANLPNGTNLWVQVAAQFTGKEEAVDLVDGWGEDRLDYSNTSRFSFGRSMDCSSVWYGMYKVFFGIDIGTWTEAQLTKLKSKAIQWAQRRPADHVLFNFKAAQGRHASHAANIMGAGLIGHTTSPSNPFRFESDTYSASKRVGLYRVLTDAQYQSLIIDDSASEEEEPVTMAFIPGDTRTAQVTQIQTCLVKLDYDLGTFGPNHDGIDGDYGTSTAAAVSKFQVDYKVKGVGTGNADEYTLLALAWELGKKSGADPAQVAQLEAVIAAGKVAFGQIEDIAAAHK